MKRQVGGKWKNSVIYYFKLKRIALLSDLFLVWDREKETMMMTDAPVPYGT